MANVYITLQEKGGVGKSLITSMWMQFLIDNGYPVMGLDTDPSNKSLKAFEGLPVDELEILNANKEIDPAKFDVLVDTVCGLGADDNMVIDTGTSCVIAMLAYLERHNPFGVMLEEGHQVIINTLIAGGADTFHTIQQFEKLVTAFPSIPVILWKNHFHGDLAIDGTPLEEISVYKKTLKKHVAAEIEMPRKDDNLTRDDLVSLMSKRLTFKEAVNSNMPVMVRRRLRNYWTEAHEVMKPALIFSEAARQKAREA
jgi:hypothetical protein